MILRQVRLQLGGSPPTSLQAGTARLRPDGALVLTDIAAREGAPGANQVLSDRLPGDMGGTPMPRLPAMAGGTGVPPVGSSVHAKADLRPGAPPPNPRAPLIFWLVGPNAGQLTSPGGNNAPLAIASSTAPDATLHSHETSPLLPARVCSGRAGLRPDGRRKIAAGRAALVAHNPTAAQARFQEALTLEPANQTAAALLGVTRMLPWRPGRLRRRFSTG